MPELSEECKERLREIEKELLLGIRLENINFNRLLFLIDDGPCRDILEGIEGDLKSMVVTRGFEMQREQAERLVQRIESMLR